MAAQDLSSRPSDQYSESQPLSYPCPYRVTGIFRASNGDQDNTLPEACSCEKRATREHRENAKLLTNINLELRIKPIHRKTNIHTFIHTYGQFSVASCPNPHVLDCGRKLELPEETAAYKGRTCELTMVSPGIKPRTLLLCDYLQELYKTESQS